MKQSALFNNLQTSKHFTLNIFMCTRSIYKVGKGLSTSESNMSHEPPFPVLYHWSMHNLQCIRKEIYTLIKMTTLFWYIPDRASAKSNSCLMMLKTFFTPSSPLCAKPQRAGLPIKTLNIYIVWEQYWTCVLWYVCL